MKSKFESWFKQQPFYLNLRLIHGDRIFDSENSVYRVLAVHIAWMTWVEQQKRIDILTDWLKEADASQEKMQSIVDDQQKRVDELKHEKSLQELEINQISQANQEWQRININLKNHIDAAIRLLPSIKAENDLWGCDQVEVQIELLEQALKGGDE